MSINLTFGRYGGFYISADRVGHFRVCLGWLAVTLFWGDFDDILEEALECWAERQQNGTS